MSINTKLYGLIGEFILYFCPKSSVTVWKLLKQMTQPIFYSFEYRSHIRWNFWSMQLETKAVNLVTLFSYFFQHQILYFAKSSYVLRSAWTRVADICGSSQTAEQIDQAHSEMWLLNKLSLSNINKELQQRHCKLRYFFNFKSAPNLSTRAWLTG